MGFKRVFRKFLEMYWEETFLLVAALFAAGMLLCPESTIFWVSWSCVVLVFLGVAYSLWRKFRQSVRETEWEKEQRDCRKNSDPIFLEDKEIEDEEGDKLGVVEDARHFGEQVLNGGSNNAMVFGLDAAWGSGKSSFLNLCMEEVWKTKENKKKVAVFTFRPILFDARRQDMAEIFIRDFFSFLKEEKLLVGSLESDGKKFIRLVSGVSIGSEFFGMNFRVHEESVDLVLGRIRKKIEFLPKKFIVIVDDLDRLYAEEVKAILGVVRNIFNIPKISFVLCYDTSNINSFEFQKKTVHTESYGDNRIGNNLENKGDEEVEKSLYSRAEHEPDNERLSAYFEKIIQVKKTLIPNREKLKSFFVEKIKGYFANPDDMNCKRFLDEVEYFFQEKNYPKYSFFLGDIRKIKRILNFIQVSRLVKLMNEDLYLRDVSSKYLIQIILIYINYPVLFRKIYIEETGGSSGFFSVIRDDTDDTNSLGFKSSSIFLEFLNGVSKEQKFLLEELFFVKNFNRLDLFEKNRYKEVINSSEFQRYSPFFNGGDFSRVNLRDYLEIVYEGKSVELWLHDNFHLNKIRELEQKGVQEIFDATSEYSTKSGEKPRDRFFERVQTKNIPFSSAEKIIEYIVSNLSHYSTTNDILDGVYNGIRDGLVYRLLWMLELRGWKDGRGESYENSDENIAILAERIFGSDRYPSMVDTLLESGGNSILSVNDATRFVYTCADTSSQSLFNVSRSLQNYAKKQSINAMEALSRRAFRFFHENLIGKKRNFLREIADMDEVLLLGDFSESIRDKFEEKGKSLEEELEKIKNGLAVALVSRFARDEEHSMGMYSFDPASPNPKKISEIMRDYLFHICFNPDGDARNAELFINFGLASFENDSTLFHEWVPNIPFLEKAFGSDRWWDYWRENGERIKNSGRALLSTAPEKKVVTYNFVATYREHMEKLFGKLDEFMKGNDF